MQKAEMIARRSLLQGSVAAPLAVAGRGGSRQPAPGSGFREQKTRLVEGPQVKRDFTKDGRSRRVVFAAHCMLNQNARHVDCADFPAMMKPMLTALQAKEIGVIQLPCPELMALGLGRDRDVPPLETIREALELPEAHARLMPYVDQVVYQIREYLFQGFRVLGILGKNGSPSCGVETTFYSSGQGPGEGVFVRLLKERLKAEGLDIGIKGIEDHRQQEAIEWLLKRV